MNVNFRKNSLTIKLVCTVFLFTAFASKSYAETVYFSDDFESNNLSKWTSAVPKAVVSSNRANNGSKSLYIPYDIPAGEPQHRDNNRFAEVNLGSKNIDHFFLRGCVNMSSTTIGSRKYAPSHGKKLFYLFSQNHGKVGSWDTMLGMYGNGKDVPFSLSIQSNWYPGYSDLRYPTRNIALGKLELDRWHCIELEMKLNTPNTKNGLVRLWVDGTLEFEKLNMSIRATTDNLRIVRVGAQSDRNGDTLVRSADRYWDDIKVSDTFSSIRPKRPIH